MQYLQTHTPYNDLIVPLASTLQTKLKDQTKNTNIWLRLSRQVHTVILKDLLQWTHMNRFGSAEWGCYFRCVV